MIKNGRSPKESFLMAYSVEVLYWNELYGNFRAVCNYRFSSSVRTVKALKDVVRRDVKEMGYNPDRIIIKNSFAGICHVIKCRKS